VLHLVDSLDIGGLETTVLRLAKAQAAAGLDVTVATLFRPGALVEAITQAGVVHAPIGKRPGFDGGALLRIRRLVRSRRTRILHTHNPVAHYYGVLATLGQPVHRVNTRHDMGVHARTRRLDRIYRGVMPATSAVVAVCEAARAAFVERALVPARLLSVIHNGIEPCALPTDAERGSARRALGLQDADRRLVVGTVGRLNTVKRIDVLVEAWRHVADARDAHLVVVGDGPERAALESLVRSRGLERCVSFVGARMDVRNLLPAFDLFALSSDTEGMSVALVEASWAGLATVATDVGGNPEIVLPEQTGILVQPGAPRALAHAIGALLADPARRNSMGRAARSRAERCWTVDAMSRAYMQVYGLAPDAQGGSAPSHPSAQFARPRA
jgi:glycosyltransferase involved in cell wall biosynthesis